MSKPDRIKIVFWAIILNLVFVFTLVAAIECYLRFDAGRYPPNDGWTVTWGHRVVNNRFGFREREVAVPKPTGTLRVLVLGDSLTWGAGLSENERYSNLLERHLRDDFPGRAMEVLNFGISGGPTVQERDILKRYIDSVQPDLVIVGFCLNDLQPYGQNYSPERERYRSLFASIASLRRVGLVRLPELLIRRVSVLLEKTGRIPTWQLCAERSYSVDSDDWKNFVKALEDISALCESHGLMPPVFAVLNQGTNSTKPTDYRNPDDTLKLYLKWYHQAEEAARQAGFVTVNFEHEFGRDLSNEILSINDRDGHPSASCNRVYAEKLRTVISPLIRSRI
jgi:hypothetical protein